MYVLTKLNRMYALSTIMISDGGMAALNASHTPCLAILIRFTIYPSPYDFQYRVPRSAPLMPYK